MSKDEEFGFGKGGDLADVGARGVGVAVVGLPLRRAAGEAEFAIDLVNEDVTAVAESGDCFVVDSVAGDNDALVGGLEVEGKAVGPAGVLDGDGSNGDVGVFVDEAGFDFGDVNAVGRGVSFFEFVDPVVDVFFVSSLNVAGHRFGAFGADELKWGVPVENGGHEIEIGEAGSVIGMEVGEEGGFEVGRGEGLDSLLCGGRGTADDAGAKIDDVGRTIDDDGGGGAGAQWVCIGSAGAEENNLSLGPGEQEQREHHTKLYRRKIWEPKQESARF